MVRQCIQCGYYAGQSDDSHRGQDEAGQLEISLCYSKRCAVKKLWIVLFLEFST